MEVPVVLEMRDGTVAQARFAHGLERRARGEAGRWKRATLCRGQKLYADDGAAIRRHVEQTTRTVGSHGNVVFLVGRSGDESTLAGCARCLFSEVSAAAVTCGIMKPELRPGRGVKNAGMPDRAGSSELMAMRRSAAEPISQIASAMISAANATGSAWKLPPDNASSVSAKIGGLSG